MYEHRLQPILPRPLFFRRLLRHGVIAFLLLFGSLCLGIAGYHITEGLSWLDSLLNASMILGGMGPVNELRTDAGKIFASFYALFSGIIFLATAGIIITPLAHRFLHRMHADEPKK
jgi:hypothetical protein